MIQFETGKTYEGRLITDNDSTVVATIIKRTAKSVTIKALGEEKRVKIHNQNDVEFFFPWGRYSMSPVIKADKEVTQ